MKEDGCKGSGYEGEKLDDKDGIVCFEGGFEVPRVWIILGVQILAQTFGYAI
jgi:hypothetical protein